MLRRFLFEGAERSRRDEDVRETMGNTAGGRRNSTLPKQESSSSEGVQPVDLPRGRPSRQSTAQEEDEALGTEPLTDRQKELLADTWKVVEGDIAKVGVITFISLFETHPDVQQVFLPFNGLPLDELKHSKQLRAHALRVMAFVQKAVARLHEPDKLTSLLKELGKKHHGYGAKPKYVDLIGPQFILAIKPSLESQWTEETHAAWSALFTFMGAIMKDAMCAEDASQKAQ